MKQLTQLTAAVVIGFASMVSLAHADQMPAPMPEAHQGMGPHEMNPEKMQQWAQKHHAKEMAELKIRLGIKPNQEQAFATFGDAIKPTFEGHDPHSRGEWEKLTTPQKIDRMQDMMAHHVAEMKRKGDATKTFYAALNSDQQKIFDLEFERFMHAHKGGEHGHHPMGH